MGASGAISAVSVPGASTALKTTITVSAIAIDASVDVSNNQTQTAFGIGGAQEKSIANVALDATFGTIGTKTSNGIVDGSKNAVANDLKPSNFAPLDAAGKQTVKTTESIVNSGAYEQTVNAATSVTVGNSGVINSTIKSNTGNDGTRQGNSRNNSSTFTPPTVQSDNTKVRPVIY
jgi:hypothetical protein